MLSATYSPEDNKLRLYADARLDAATYQRVKAAGFTWAPRQQLFVAPMWTPSREDLLIDLCGEIGDEDTSLVERAEERGERFEGYQANRLQDAERARRAVDAIADGIPLGQPILVGHHSERHARKHAEKIESGMRHAVKMWETAQYWKDRAAGAIRAAKYKERPDVRARRIKKLEADHRKQLRTKQQAEAALKAWSYENMTLALAIAIAGRDHVSKCFPLSEYPRELPASQYEGMMSLYSALQDGIITAEQARDIAVRCHENTVDWADRWIRHYENRLTYERAMLADQGGIASDRTDPEKGGACRCWCSPGYGKGWSYIKKVNKVSVSVEDNWGNGGGNFKRTVAFDKLKAVMSRASVDEARASGRLHEAANGIGFYLDEPAETRDQAKDRIHKEAIAGKAADSFQAMKDTLRSGVQVVSAPQLFPTPPDLARRVVELANVQAGQRVLEPSAGTGNMIKAVIDRCTGCDCVRIVAVEINLAVAEQLRERRNKTVYANDANYDVRCCDFLECNGDLGLFDRVVMNPPFANGADIRHIEHALTFLKPGGRLVAICANGPRQRDRLMPLADEWIDLPAGSFTEAGTQVNTAIFVKQN